MNYAIAFLGGIIISAAFFWYVSRESVYIGPLIEAQLDENASGDIKNGFGSSVEFQRNDKKAGELTA